MKYDPSSEIVADNGGAMSRLHGITPYIGKLSPNIARTLILEFSNQGDTVVDPFCGSGTVPLEAAMLGRTAVGGDLSPYAAVATSGKLFPYSNPSDALVALARIAKQVQRVQYAVDLRQVPQWVRVFFHRETLREAIAWSNVLRKEKEYFLFACFLNILHHQRPGFLSYPSAHAVPYLRVKNFPRTIFPELYGYREVLPRMIKKVNRTIDESATLVSDASRWFAQTNAVILSRRQSADLVLSSPPYMSELDYGRDNRLRLWFVGCTDWRKLDANVSPTQLEFVSLIEKCIRGWAATVNPRGHVVLIVGDPSRTGKRVQLATLLRATFEKYKSIFKEIRFANALIPNNRRVRRDLRGTTTDSILAYQRRC